MTLDQRTLLRAKLCHTGFLEIKLRGRCMEPFLVAGDAALIYLSKEFRVGDICLIEVKSREIALHRIVKIYGDTVLTKGDFAGLVEHQRKEDILGIARAFKMHEKDEWLAYTQSSITRKTTVFLSLGIARDDAIRNNTAIRKVCKKLIWKKGMRSRVKLIECGVSI